MNSPQQDPPSSPVPDQPAQQPWSWRLRCIVSGLLGFHLLVTFGYPFTMAPSSSVAMWLFRCPLFRRYAEVADLDNGYKFFAPDPPTRARQIRYVLEYADGSTEEGLFPDRSVHIPRLLYHRHFMLSEQIEPWIVPRDYPSEYDRYLERLFREQAQAEQEQANQGQAEPGQAEPGQAEPGRAGGATDPQRMPPQSQSPDQARGDRGGANSTAVTATTVQAAEPVTPAEEFTPAEDFITAEEIPAQVIFGPQLPIPGSADGRLAGELLGVPVAQIQSNEPEAPELVDPRWGDSVVSAPLRTTLASGEVWGDLPLPPLPGSPPSGDISRPEPTAEQSTASENAGEELPDPNRLMIDPRFLESYGRHLLSTSGATRVILYERFRFVPVLEDVRSRGMTLDHPLLTEDRRLGVVNADGTLGP